MNVMTDEAPKKKKKGFQKGQSGNPLGGRIILYGGHDGNFRQRRAEVVPLMVKIAYSSMEELKVKWEDPNLPAIERALIVFFKKMVEDGCPERLNIFYNRVVGRPRESIEVDLTKESQVEVQNMSNEELAKKLETIRNQIIEQKDLQNVRHDVTPDETD